MPGKILRNPTLRKVETAVIQNWLTIARNRGYTAAVLSLEFELSLRDVLDDAAPEPAFPLSYVADAERRRTLARARLETAASEQCIEAFHDNLLNLDPANFGEAWRQARTFATVQDRAEAMIHVALGIVTHFKGHDEATCFIAYKTDNKTPEQIIAALEDHFGKLIDRARLQVQNA